MISLVLDAAKKIIDSVLTPSVWTVDNAQGVNSAQYPRVAFESTILKHKIKDLGAINLQINSTFQYQVNFRFDGKLRYDELPIRELTNIMSYVAFIFSAHGSLLEKSVTDLDGYNTWAYTKVDPCLYESDSSIYTVRQVDLNSFIPILEQSNNDWLVILVFSFDVTLETSKASYRKFFEDYLTDQIISNPGLIGGKIGEINQVTLSVRDKGTSKLAGFKTVDLNP